MLVAITRALAPLRPGRWAAALLATLSLGLVLTIGGLLRPSGCAQAPTIGSFNIRYFPQPGTDLARVAELIAELDAEVFAVQEITDREAFERVLARASRATGRDYRLILTRCIDDQPAPYLANGIVYDLKRLELLATRDFPQLLPDDGQRCGRWIQPGVAGVFEDLRGHRLAVMSVHFKPFPRNRRTRRVELSRALQLADTLASEFDARVVVLGDMNTTDDDEPSEFEQRARERGYALPTRSLNCTEYWRRPDESVYRPSRLDHAIVGPDWSGRAEVLGMCADLACRPVVVEDMHSDFTRVSDHCPIRLRGTW